MKSAIKFRKVFCLLVAIVAGLLHAEEPFSVNPDGFSYNLLNSAAMVNFALESKDERALFTDQSFLDRAYLYDHIKEIYYAHFAHYCPENSAFKIKNSLGYMQEMRPLSVYEKRELLELLMQGYTCDAGEEQLLRQILSLSSGFSSENALSFAKLNFERYMNMFWHTVLSPFFLVGEMKTLHLYAKEGLLKRYLLELLFNHMIILMENIALSEGGYDQSKIFSYTSAIRQEENLLQTLCFYAGVSKGSKKSLFDALLSHLYCAVHGHDISSIYASSGLREVLEKILYPHLILEQGKKTLLKHALPGANKKHAYELITKRQRFVSLLQENERLAAEIVRVLREIQYIHSEKAKIDIGLVEGHLARYIPEAPFSWWGSSKLVYAVSSFVKQYRFGFLSQVFARAPFFSALSGQITTPAMRKQLEDSMDFIPDNLNLTPEQGEKFQEQKMLFLAEQKKKLLNVDDNSPSLWSSVRAMVVPPFLSRLTLGYGNNMAIPQTYGDYVDAAKQMLSNASLGLYIHRPEEKISIKGIGDLLACVMGVGGVFAPLALEATEYFETYKNIYMQCKTFMNLAPYLRLCEKEMDCARRLLILVAHLYKDAGVSIEEIPHEIRKAAEYMGSESLYQGARKNLAEWQLSGIKAIKNIATGMVFPGLLTHHYFHKIKNNKIIFLMNEMLGEIDAACAKVEVLKKEFNNGHVFSMPVIQWDVESPLLHIEKGWYPRIEDPIANDFELGKATRNMLLLSPYGGGKTVVLKTILLCLYMAPLGIVPASACQFSYFDHIINYTGHSDIESDVGGGLSSHLSDLERIEHLKEFLFQAEGKIFVLIDEIYRGSMLDSAVRSALEDLPEIMGHKNLLTVISTHYEQLTVLKDNPQNEAALYYLQMQETEDGRFESLYKLFADNDQNWWPRDPEKRARYDRWQKERIRKKLGFIPRF